MYTIITINGVPKECAATKQWLYFKKHITQHIKKINNPYQTKQAHKG